MGGVGWYRRAIPAAAADGESVVEWNGERRVTGLVMLGSPRDHTHDKPSLLRFLNYALSAVRRIRPAPRREVSDRIRAVARAITAGGSRRLPSARHAATVLRKHAAIVPQHAHVLMCRSIRRRRAGVRSPSR